MRPQTKPFIVEISRSRKRSSQDQAELEFLGIKSAIAEPGGLPSVALAHRLFGTIHPIEADGNPAVAMAPKI